MPETTISPDFRDALLFEFGIAETQLLGLAETIPAEKFSWRPNETTRSVSEVRVHVAGGNFFLLEFTGRKAPSDIYDDNGAQGEERWWSIAKTNDKLEKTLIDKDQVKAFLSRSMTIVREAIIQTDERVLAEPVMRRAYMRIIAHCHEHMGQMIAYTRSNGLRVPWPDWRPDRRS